MCRYEKKRVLALIMIAFGLGVLFSCFVRGFILNFLEAAALIAAGILLLGSQKR